MFYHFIDIGSTSLFLGAWTSRDEKDMNDH